MVRCRLAAGSDRLRAAAFGRGRRGETCRWHWDEGRRPHRTGEARPRTVSTTVGDRATCHASRNHLPRLAFTSRLTTVCHLSHSLCMYCRPTCRLSFWQLTTRTDSRHQPEGGCARLVGQHWHTRADTLVDKKTTSGKKIHPGLELFVPDFLHGGYFF